MTYTLTLLAIIAASGTVSLSLLAMFVALQVADYWTTMRCIAAGRGHEANPVMAWLMARIGVGPAFVGMKLVAIALAMNLFVISFAPFVLAALCAWYGWVAWNNWRIARG